MLSEEIKEIRKKTGMSQAKFAETFGMSPGTLRNWEQGIASPPQYVMNMIKMIMEDDSKMINVETVRFVKLLNDLAEKSKIGILPFSTLPPALFESVLCYNDRSPDAQGHYKLIRQAVFDDEEETRLSVSSYYEDTDGYVIRAHPDTKDGTYVTVRMKDGSLIMIENGMWYFV